MTLCNVCAQTIESDFYATEAGRAHFRDQLTSIRYCVQETCNCMRHASHDFMHALLHVA